MTPSLSMPLPRPSLHGHGVNGSWSHNYHVKRLIFDTCTSATYDSRYNTKPWTLNRPHKTSSLQEPLCSVLVQLTPYNNLFQMTRILGPLIYWVHTQVKCLVRTISPPFSLSYFSCVHSGSTPESHPEKTSLHSYCSQAGGSEVSADQRNHFLEV